MLQHISMSTGRLLKMIVPLDADDEGKLGLRWDVEAAALLGIARESDLLFLQKL